MIFYINNFQIIYYKQNKKFINNIIKNLNIKYKFYNLNNL